MSSTEPDQDVAPALGAALSADWTACSDPPEESCSDAGCPQHGDVTGPGEEES